MQRLTFDRDRPVATAQVTESMPYRFSREGGVTVFRSDAEYDLATDLFTVMATERQPSERKAAQARIDDLIRTTFDVDRADTAGASPSRHRSDLWQPQRDYATPLWDMVAAGETDGASFNVPKFVSDSALVGDATEGTEPAGGSFIADLQTITPAQAWGKVEITRQATRIGNAQLSGILWDQMLRKYHEAREAAVAAFLTTLTAATDITLTGTPASSPDNDDDRATAGELRAAITRLQFVRGGNRFRAFAAHQALYELLARVTDGAGRPLHPQVGSQNALGTALDSYSTLDVAGVTAVPAYGLGTPGTSPTNSWLFDPAVVRGWASKPERLFWNFGATAQTAKMPQLSFVTVGILGDLAFANLDISGVRQIVFDPSV
jgi:hypothetical protein